MMPPSVQRRAPRPPFYTDAIPAMDELQTTYANVEICTPDFAACTSTCTQSTIASPMQVAFAATPRESAPVTHVRVPTMPNVLLALLALLVTGLGLRARQAIRGAGTRMGFDPDARSRLVDTSAPELAIRA